MPVVCQSDGEQPAEQASRFQQPAPDWRKLTARIRRGDQSGMEELYRIFSRGVRFYLCRQLGPQELDDRVHDTFLIVVRAIQRGELRQPDCLMGFVRTVVRRQVASYIDRAVQQRKEQLDLDHGSTIADSRSNPERSAIDNEQTEIMLRVLRGISRRDREILTRFYLLNQVPEQICLEMGLTETQFRLLKSRAKTRFGELGRRRLLHRPVGSVFLRNAKTA